ncbi:MAG TPA: TIGR02266 family protein, partial [Labilithrix sp.]|nr:TIGR02266 family protein [Labilithrix sp.]
GASGSGRTRCGATPDFPASVLQRFIDMGKKSKKQRPKKQKARSRRESGIVPRSAASERTVTDVLAVQDASPPAVRTEGSSPEPAVDEVAGAAGQDSSRNAIRPQQLTPIEAADALAADIHAPTAGVGESPEGDAPAVEHRASRRVAVAVDIHFASDSHFFSGLSGDISEGGLFLSTYRPLDVGTEVDLEFSLPGEGRALHARGEVRWIREHSAYQSRGVGIAFEDLSEDDRERIHAFCSSRPPLYYDDVG